MHIDSLAKKSLKRKLWIVYILLFILPILFSAYIVIKYFFPEKQISEELILTLIIGVVGMVIGSLSALFLIRRSIASIQEMTKKATRTFPIMEEDLKLIGDDEAARLAHSFTKMTGELQNRIQEVNRYAQELASANAKLTELAIKDGLTGLYNRKYFEERLKQELARAQHYQCPLSLIMLDVDNFKNYNDTNGHPQGDKLLQDISAIIRNNIRVIDVPVRYGGEEFMVLLPEIGTKESSIIAEKLKSKVHHHPFPNEELQPSGVLTVSVGVCSYPENAETTEDLIEAVDTAMYAAKRQGKDRVVTYIGRLRQP